MSDKVSFKLYNKPSNFMLTKALKSNRESENKKRGEKEKAKKRSKGESKPNLE